MDASHDSKSGDYQELGSGSASGREGEESHSIDSWRRVSTNQLSGYRTKQDLQRDSAGFTGRNLTASKLNLRQGCLSPAAGGRGFFWPKRLPLADLFR